MKNEIKKSLRDIYEMKYEMMKMAGEHAQQLGLTFAKKNFPGHQALVCTHIDGHNKSGNIHVHIVIYSLRKYDISQELYMEFDSETTAGYKHHLSTAERSLCSKSKAHQFKADGSDCCLHTGTWL